LLSFFQSLKNKKTIFRAGRRIEEKLSLSSARGRSFLAADTEGKRKDHSSSFSGG